MDSMKRSWLNDPEKKNESGDVVRELQGSIITYHSGYVPLLGMVTRHMGEGVNLKLNSSSCWN